MVKVTELKISTDFPIELIGDWYVTTVTQTEIHAKAGSAPESGELPPPLKADQTYLKGAFTVQTPCDEGTTRLVAADGLNVVVPTIDLLKPNSAKPAERKTIYLDQTLG